MALFNTGSKQAVAAAVVFLLATAILPVAAPSAWALDPERTLAQYHHTAWTLRDGLPFSGITSVAQTPDGFLWLGTASGLYRFDGVHAEPIGERELSNPRIQALATDSRGDLWIGLLDTQVARLRRGELAVFDIPTPGMKGSAFVLVPDPDGSIWVATRDKVHNFDGHKWKVFDDPWPLSATEFSDPGGVWALALGRDGTLWSKNLLGLYYLRRGANAFEQAPGYAGGLVDFARDAHGRLWTSDFQAKRFYALPDLISGKPVPKPELRAAVPPAIVGVIRTDRDGTLWNANRVIGFMYRASSLDSPGTPDRFTVRDGLTAEFPMTVFEDREGNIWIPTDLGLDRFRNANIVIEPDVGIRSQAAAMVATRDAVFVYSGMRALVPDPDGDPGGRLFRIRAGHEAEIVEEDFGRVTSLAAAPDGSLVFSRDGALLRWRDGKVTKIATPPELEGGHVVNLVATVDDGLVVSFYQRGVHRLAAGVWSNITPADAPPQETASVAIDASGAVWLFYRYHRSRVVRIERGRTTEFSSPISTVSAALSDPDGIILVGINGLARFDGHELLSIDTSREPILSRSYGIAQSSDGAVWLATQAGIVRIDKAALLKAFASTDEPLEYQLFDTSDGFAGSTGVDMFNGEMISGPDGRVWFFTSEGVAWTDPARLYRNLQPPPVVITSVVASGQRYDMPQTLSLPAGTSQVEIDYTALSLSMPERARFRYRLAGVDERWVDAGGRREAFYTNLPPGEHRFQVIAANGDGVWNDQGATLSLTIAPTFLQSNGFKLLLSLVIAVLAWLAYRLLLRQQAERLHKRFAIRLAERERIARELHDTLLQSVQGLILRFDAIASRVPADSELYSSAHDALRQAESVVAEGRERVRGLRTTTKADLAQAIAELAHELIQGDKPRFTLHVEGAPRALHAIVSDELLRIAAEGIRNAVQHSGASSLEVSVGYRPEELRVTVRDDGVGIPQSVLATGSKVGHYGLVGMRERAQRIGGRLAMTSGAGTEITATVPGRAAYKSRDSRLLRRFRPVRADIYE